jgi:cGMP-dependent protein kinase
VSCYGCTLQLASSFLFEGLQADDLTQVVDAMRRTTVSAGATVMRQGDVGDMFYVVISGTLNVAVDGKVVSMLTSGNHFGELALMFNCTR